MWTLYLNADGTVKSWKKYGNGAAGCGGFLIDAAYFGSSITFLGDLDGAGGSASAIAVGTPGDRDGGIYSGAVWILFLDANETVTSKIKIGHGSSGFGSVLSATDYFGSSVANLGDLDGDGVVDIAVGIPHDDDGGFECGSVWILFLKTNGTVKSAQKISPIEGGLVSDVEFGDEFGSSLAAGGDLNGDGVPDLIVGCAKDDDGGWDLGADRGAARILFLNPNGTVKYQQKISALAGGFGGTLDDGDTFGCAVVAMGDHDGDGLDDIVVGARADDDGGPDRGAFWFLSLDCRTPASATLRNPSIAGFTNPDVYSVTGLPVIGGTFTASVTLVPQHAGAFLVGYSTPLSVTWSWGNVLVNTADPRGELLGGPASLSNPAIISATVPSDVALIGFTLATQAVRFGGGMSDLTNAQDLRVGW